MLTGVLSLSMAVIQIGPTRGIVAPIVGSSVELTRRGVERGSVGLRGGGRWLLRRGHGGAIRGTGTRSSSPQFLGPAAGRDMVEKHFFLFLPRDIHLCSYLRDYSRVITSCLQIDQAVSVAIERREA